MRSRFATSADDSSDDFFGNPTHDFSGNSLGDGASPALPSFSAWAGAFNQHNWGTPIPVSALTGEAQEAMAAQSGPVSTVSVSSGTGFTINLLYDAAAMAAPQSFRDTIQQAANLLAASISDHITVNIKIDYSGTGGGAAAGPDAGLYEPYSLVRSNLIANASSGDTTFNSLPTGTSIQGQSQVAVWNAQLKLWGLLSPTDTTTDDGSATFATDINSNLLLGVALHELTHAMGRVPYGPQPDIFDLFRFTSSGVRLFNGAATAPAAYFSLDNGVTRLADYGKTSDSSDFLNSGIQGPNDPFNEFYSGTTLQKLTTVDLKQMDALGFHLLAATNSPPVISTPSGTNVLGTPSQVYQLSSLFAASDPDNDTLTYSIFDATTGASTGHIKINGVTQAEGQWIQLTQAQLSQTTFTAGTAGLDTLTFSVSDPTHNTQSSIKVGSNSAPVIATPSGTSVSGTAGQVYQLSSLFTASDPDNDPLTYYIYDGTAGASTGHIKINGVTQAEGQWVLVTQAQLSQTTFTAGTGGTDTLYFSVYDPMQHNAFSSVQVAALKAANSAPVIATPSGANVLGTPSQVYQLSSLFAASDPDSDTLTYSIFDATTGASTGHIKINGVTQAEGQWIQLTQAQLSQTTFTAGTAGLDTLTFSVSDPTHNTQSSIKVGSNSAPVIATPSGANVLGTPSQVYQLSSLFAASDPDSDTLTYSIFDATTGASTGHIKINGVTQAEGQWIQLTAAQLSQTTFTAGTAGLDTLTFSVSDPTHNTQSSIKVGSNSAPVIATPSGANVLGTPNQVFQLSSLFTASDPDSDPLSYYIYDATVGSSTGHIKINGVTQAEGQWVQLTQAQLSQTTFTVGASGSDALYFSVYDPTHNAISSVSVGSNSAPVISLPSGASVSGTSGQVYQLSSLFAASDPDNDPLSYYIYDATTGASTGHIKINGVTQAEGQWVQLTQAQLSQTTFTAGTGGTDNLYFSVYDPMQHNAFNGVSVTAAAGVKPALSASSSVAPDALNHQPLQIAAYDGFVFNNPQNIDGHSAGATSGPSFFGGQDGNSHSGPGNESGSHQPGGPIDGLHWDPVGEVTPPVSGIHVTLHPTDHFLV